MLKRIVLSVCAAVAAAVSAQGETLYWKGVTASAKTASNWCTDEGLTAAASAAPTTGDSVVFVAASGDMTWDINDVALASWTQQTGYVGTVTFKTGRQNEVPTKTATVYGYDVDGTKVLKITGDCTLNSGIWTHDAQPSLSSSTEAWKNGRGVYALIVQVDGDMTLGDAAKIDVTARGFLKGQGPGKPGGQAGASHGGWGGCWNSAACVPCYGSFRHPVTLGSGGNSEEAASAGGGAVRLTVAGTLTLSATSEITANGQEPASYYPASGGSIWITAGTIVGGGVISANGASPTRTDCGGGGGGGRLSFVLTGEGADFPDGFKLIPTVRSGFKGSANNGFGGTICYKTKADGAGDGELWAIPGGSSHTDRGSDVLADDGASFHLRKVVLSEGAALNVRDGVETFAVDEIDSASESGTTVGNLRSMGGTLVLRGAARSPRRVNVWMRGGEVLQIGDEGSETLEIDSSSMLTVDMPATLNGSLHVAPYGVVRHTRESSAEVGSLRLSVTGNVTVDAYGEITALGLGYGQGAGPGASGMHGGRAYGAANGRHCYGSVTRPTMYGSGGSYGDAYGGGAIVLTVLGDLVNNGTVTADGANASYYSGAGGSVWVRAKTLAGAGVFSASGGISNGSGKYGKPGAGGRVALWLTDASADFSGFTGRYEAFGGRLKNGTISSSGGGGAGTVYLQTGAQQEHEGTLIVDNNGSTTYETEIYSGGGSADVTDTEVGDVIIRNGGKLKVDMATLAVHGAWSNLTANAAVGGKVVFVDATRPSFVGGTSEFSSLECVTPGKQLVFPPASEGETRVSAGGVLKLVGDAEHAVSLASLAEETEWIFTVGAGASCELRYLDVNRSNASYGNLLVARDSVPSAEKHNLHWDFPNIVPGMTNAWQGTMGRDWVNPENWSQSRLPVETDCVLVPGSVGAANGPVLSGLPVAISNLIVESGASLDLGGVDLTVFGFTRVAGALTARGSETLRLCGDVDLTGATVVPAHSTVVLPGDGTWCVKTGTAVLWDVVAEKGGGLLTFPDGLTAMHGLRLVATGAWTADFTSSAVTCSRATFSGTVAGAAALTLTGTGWTLDAKGDVGATGVRVDHCTATRATVYADVTSVDVGSNRNWAFGDRVCRWTGGSGNWSSASWSGGTPDATSQVVIDTAATVTVDVPAAAGSVIVRGGGNLKVGSRLSVAGTLEADDGGTVTLNTEEPVVVTNTLVVRAGGKVTTVSQKSLTLTVEGDVLVEKDGEISALGMGYATNAGPGGSKAGNVSGMHGGRVSKASDSQHCYGSITRPIAFGSGSGSAGNGCGGGAVRMVVHGELANNGVITADGGAAAYYSGAGGSVWIEAKTLSGTGTFSANGGISADAGTQGAPGSGGRVALWLTGEGADFEDFENAGGRFEAFGGKVKGKTVQDSSGGGAGTVYLQTGAQLEHEGTLVIDNGGANTFETEICAGGIGEEDVIDTEVGDVIIRNGGKLKVDTATLTVHGDILTGTTFTEVNGAVVFVDAARDSLVTGKNTFSHFICETPGKHLNFGTGADDLLSVSDGGSFVVVGSDERPVVLRGDDPTAYWKLGVASTAEINVEHVDPAKSDAGGGQTVVAKNSEAGKEQDNKNWKFSTVVPGMEITWTGAAGNSLWSDGGNWDLERAPVETDRVVIPALAGGEVGYPRLNGFAVRMLSLSIAAGASLQLDGGELTVVESTSVSGSLVASGDERVELLGNVAFALGAFTPMRSTVCLSGGAAQQVGFSGARFFSLTVEKNGGSVAFSDGFSVDNQLTLRATGTWTAQFAPACEFACERLSVDGTVDDVAALTLTGTDAWNLKVRTYADVRGVKVRNSRATGIAIYPQIPATDLLGNVNWRFGVLAKTWLGGDGDFSAEDKWDGGAPGENDFAVIDGAATVTVSESARVGLISVRGTAARLIVRDAFEVVDSLTVAEGGTVVIDSPVTVGGSVSVLAGGTLTHSENGAEEIYKMDLTVGGGMLVDVSGAVDVCGMGYAKSCGPGGRNKQSQNGGSYGGIGTIYGGGVANKSYGSVFRPFSLGSGGGYSADEKGGGAVKIVVAGTLTVNGVINADGAKSVYYSGSGGSVWLTCGTLVGAGRICADGGVTTNSEPGGGGRAAVYQTKAADWSSWTGVISAYGGRTMTATGLSSPKGSAGTVYKQCAGEEDRGGVIVIDNDDGSVWKGTSILPDVEPGERPRDFRLARFVVRGGAQLNVTTNMTVGDVSLEMSTSKLSVPNSTLSIRSRVHEDGIGWKGTYSTDPAGRIIWKKPGMALIIR